MLVLWLTESKFCPPPLDIHTPVGFIETTFRDELASLPKFSVRQLSVGVGNQHFLSQVASGGSGGGGGIVHHPSHSDNSCDDFDDKMINLQGMSIHTFFLFKSMLLVWGYVRILLEMRSFGKRITYQNAPISNILIHI